MVYRKVQYNGESKKVLLKRINEIEIRGEQILWFTIETIDGKTFDNNTKELK